MIVDGIALYAGFRLERPEVPEEARIAFTQLIEEVGFDWRQENKKFLQDFYYHYDVFAMHMASFKKFAERYPCKLVPIEQ
jgi:hypothetical protein